MEWRIVVMALVFVVGCFAMVAVFRWTERKTVGALEKAQEMLRSQKEEIARVNAMQDRSLIHWNVQHPPGSAVMARTEAGWVAGEVQTPAHAMVLVKGVGYCRLESVKRANLG